MEFLELVTVTRLITLLPKVSNLSANLKVILDGNSLIVAPIAGVEEISTVWALAVGVCAIKQSTITPRSNLFIIIYRY
jgi:hypothetical protein